MKLPCVYILTSRKDGAIYIGVTSDITKRVYEHKQGLADGYTKRYNIKHLVYVELHENMKSAITREKTNESVEKGVENPINRKR